MAMFEYECSKGHITTKLFFGSEEIPNAIVCECGQAASKIISSPNFKVKQGQCGNAETGYSGDYRNVKPMDQKTAKDKAIFRAGELNHGRDPGGDGLADE